MNDVKFEPHVFSHYTSLDVLKSIVETKTLRMTDYRFLNDPKELKLGFSIYKKACNKSPKINKYIKFLKKIDEYESGISTSNLFVGANKDGSIKTLLASANYNYYIFSLSNTIDSIPMWNYYGNNGVSIVFNSQKLLTFFHEIRDKYAGSGFLNLCRGDVMYGDSADDLLLLHPQALEISHVGDEDTLLINSKHLILQHVSLIKSRAWEYEQEYRIGYPLEAPLMKIMQHNNDLGFTSTLKDSIIKPQIILNNFPLDAIDKIIISPFNRNNLTKPSIEELLNVHGISTIEVINSNIAVR